MHNLLLTIDPTAIDWSRAQFALTAIYHWLFVPLTLGLALIMAIMETCYYKTRDVFWRDTAKFWQRLFGVNFAMGVATGIILEFEFGTNWSNYSWFVGDIFGAPLAIEGIVAFFMESTFVAVMFFGWKKVSAGFHLAATWLTGLGATISAWWILVANAWMQHPVGCAFNPDTVRNEMVSFADVALSPFAVDKFFHTVISSWIVGAAFVVAVSCWYLLRKREQRLSIVSIKIASIVGIVASRIVEEFYRPTIILCDDNNMMKGSGRSIREFDLYAGLQKTAHVLAGFGGHKLAAGVRLEPNQLERFREAFERVVADELGEQPLTPALLLECELDFQQASDSAFLQELELMQPFGAGNAEPVFASPELTVVDRSPLGYSGDHVRLRLKDSASGITLMAKGWNMATAFPPSSVGSRIRVAYTPRLDYYRGVASIDVGIKDWQPVAD